jgi:hypothetical protein
MLMRERRIRRALRRDVAVEAFVMEENGDAEARVFLHPLLDCVRELDHRARIAVFAWTRNFADAVFQKRRRAVGQEVALVIDEELVWVGEK